MKQYLTALAALLATTSAGFTLETTFDDDGDIFIGIELDNPVTLKLPRTKPPAEMCFIECTGWQLADDTAVYTDFTVEAMTVGKRTKFVLTAIGETNMDGELVEFENTCNVDDMENILETKEILVTVFPFRPDP